MKFSLLAVFALLAAIPDGASEWNISSRLWDNAEKVTLERGKVTEVALKLTDPFLDQ